MTTKLVPIITTLQAIRDERPCKDGWKKLVKYLGGTSRVNMDAPLPLETVLESNGYVDTLWCFRAIAPDVRKRLICLWLADVLEHSAKDKPNKWLRDGAQLLRDYDAGRVTKAELETFRQSASAYAYAAASTAAGAAARAADAAAYASDAYASAAASAYASDAYAAAAASTAAGAASAYAYDATYDAERAWQSDRLGQYLRGEV